MVVNSTEYAGLFERIGKCPLFGECSESELSQLLETSYSKKLSRGKMVYESGDFARDVYLLLDGGVKLCADSSGQRPKVIQLVYPMELFGLFDVLTDRRRDLSAIAIAAGEVLVVDGDAFTGVLNGNARFSVGILSGWGERFREISSWCFRFNHCGAREKVAAYLIKELPDPKGEHLQRVTPTRRDIASLIGITPETLSRELSYFRRRGWIRIREDGKLHVTDRQSLGILLDA